MMVRFYGFNNLYGIGTRDNDNERIGYVVVFCSRAARDQWVRGEVLRNGNYCHEAITAAEARREMIRAAFDYMVNADIIGERADLKYVSIDAIISAYCRATI